jgi:hypothetical protein
MHLADFVEGGVVPRAICNNSGIKPCYCNGRHSTPKCHHLPPGVVVRCLVSKLREAKCNADSTIAPSKYGGLFTLMAKTLVWRTGSRLAYIVHFFQLVESSKLGSEAPDRLTVSHRHFWRCRKSGSPTEKGYEDIRTLKSEQHSL